MVLEESILIVSDDKRSRAVWSEAIQKLGFVVECFNNHKEAHQLFDDHHFGLVIVDLHNGSRADGVEFVEWINTHHSAMDVIVITTSAILNYSLEILRKCTYDYLITPINLTDLVSRVRRCMDERREHAERLEMIEKIEMMLTQLKQQLLDDEDIQSNPDHVLENNDLVVDRRKRLVINEGKPVQLSPTEFEMLDYLASNADRVVSASELIRAVQGYDMDEMDARPIVRVNIRRLRQKIESDTNNPERILTVRSRGYRFAV